ncbi:tetraspanin-18-like [Daphnia carinata]|uniref:tetraspanin-18-like n=1 Tax=Daphnia carinata TaxID=120202 RepID=UPI00257E7664|nr:tetraspanin-18-like [Daphnia carinata]
MSFKKQNWGWMRHVLTALSILIFFLGCIVIGYMAWVLATSTTVNRFLSGTLIFTYTVIALGFFLFVNGLIGWVGTVSQSIWLVRLFLGASVLCILGEIGGIITLNIVRIQTVDVVEHGWLELNQGTRNMIQSSMECCGFSGPQEFAYSTLPIDDSCYEPHSDNSTDDDGSAIARADWDETTFTTPHMRLKQIGCGQKLHNWFEENKVGWVAGLATIGAVEFMAAAVALFILRRLQTSLRPRTLSRRRLRQHETDMANDPLPSELP